MRVQKIQLALSLTASSAAAFAARSSAFTGRSLAMAKHQRMGTTIMVFGNMFGGGGAYAQRIPYDTLDHPGPELAQLAQENKISANSPANPKLSLATFGAGCF